MTTVNERGGPQTGDLHRARAGRGGPKRPSASSRGSAFYPEDVSGDEVKAENVRQFSDSEADAIAAR